MRKRGLVARTTSRRAVALAFGRLGLIEYAIGRPPYCN